MRYYVNVSVVVISYGNCGIVCELFYTNLINAKKKCLSSEFAQVDFGQGIIE